MKRVFGESLWHGTLPQQTVGKLLSFRSDIKNWERHNRLDPLFRTFRIPLPGLCQHQSGNVRIKDIHQLWPQGTGFLLTRGNNEVACWLPGVIAHNRGFNVYLSFHRLNILPLSGAGKPESVNEPQTLQNPGVVSNGGSVVQFFNFPLPTYRFRLRGFG